MMGTAVGRQDRLFYSFNLEDRVPADHLLRQIDAVLDLSWLRSALAPFYSHTGCPSVDPALLIRMLLVGYCYSIRSERRLPEAAKEIRTDRKDVPSDAWRNLPELISEDRTYLEVLRQRRVQPEHRKDQDLREDGIAVAHGDVGDELDERHGAGLLHAASTPPACPNRFSRTSTKVRLSPSRMASRPVCVGPYGT